MKTYLYFFEAPGRIKIGISKNPRRRLADVGAHMEASPKLIDAIPGDYDLEKWVHKRLNEHRLKGEWFADCDPVRELIDGLLRDGPAALGYKPEPKISGALFQSPERTPAEWLEMFNTLVAMVWPDDPAGGLAEWLEIPVEEVRAHLADCNMPRFVPAAFSAKFTQWMFSESAEASAEKASQS